MAEAALSLFDGKILGNPDFAPFKHRVDAAKPLIFL